VPETSQKTVVGVDGSDDGVAALRRAKRVCAAMHAEMHIVHVR